MSYWEKLQTQEWKAKRYAILERDKFECQRCGMKVGDIPNIISFSYEELMENYGMVFSATDSNHEVTIVDLFFGLNPLRTKINNDKPENFIGNLKEYSLVMYGYQREKNQINLFDENAANNIPIKIWNPDVTDYIVSLIKHDAIRCNFVLDFELDFESAYSTPTKKISEVAKTHFEVHHKCYRQGIEPWAQKNSDYISLCNICHRGIHESTLIPFYRGNEVNQLMEPCKKCGGMRYFVCYRHRDHGICYGCEGTGVASKFITFLND